MELGTIFLIAAAILVGVLGGPELWFLIGVLLDRGQRPTQVRLRDGPVGRIAEARRDFVRRLGASRGQVFVDGEIWMAECKPPVAVSTGDRLRITGRLGLQLQVEPVEGDGTERS